ncbi:MAG TPA: uroporphyrinogen-III C-methyltransferase [Candidatus Baltobacteraceae bacterium]
MSEPGKVFLVGAGPGDPGLLTLRAAHALRHAEVLLYDALASDPTIALVPKSCERIFVGKRGGNHALPQAEIEALMVRKAREGKRIVRLKGGDPFVFGRGGEEAQALHAARVPFEIVPGITSAIAAPAYAGIPVTHREHNVAFTVVTGHEDPTKGASTIDWGKLADPHQTLVLLMAMGNLREIVARLLENGLPAQRPAAVIKDGTRPTQQTVVATLATVAEAVEREGIGAPAIVIIGEVAALREEIAWFDRSPLFGKRVLVTRPRGRDDDFAQGLWSLGAQPVLAPTIAIGPPDEPRAANDAIDRLREYDWIVFTSRHGVEAFFDRLAARGADARYVGGCRVAAIGPKTAGALRERGIVADLTPAQYVGEALATALIEASIPGNRVLVFRAQEARDALPEMLRAAGRIPDVVAAYKTTYANDPSFAESVERCDILTFTSASTVHGFVANMGGAAAACGAARGKTVACIGPITAQAARDSGFDVTFVAEAYTADGLLAALEEHAGSAPS